MRLPRQRKGRIPIIRRRVCAPAKTWLKCLRGTGVCLPTNVAIPQQPLDSPDEVRTTEEWLPMVYDELRRLAASRLVRESGANTLQPTALVHEAWLRLVGTGPGSWENRRHFFAAAAEAMRRILVDRARRRNRLRHGGGLDRVDIQDSDIASPLPDDRLLALHEALDRLAQFDTRAADVVRLKFFLGMTAEEIARETEVSVPTIERTWRVARLWLYREVSGLG